MKSKKTKELKDDIISISVRINSKIYRNFKVRVVKEGLTCREVIRDLIEDYTKS